MPESERPLLWALDTFLDFEKKNTETAKFS